MFSCNTQQTKQVPLLRDVHKKRVFKDKVDALRQEIRTLSSLKHPNIVSYLGTSKSNRNLYVHLEFVEGGSLAQLIHEFGVLSLPLIQHYTQQILNGLEFLHSKGLVHRDIKPNNILVSKDGCCKLADFGCAKHLDELCERASYSGTAIYMSPESHRQKDVGSKSDIWSLGCTIIEMANGFGPIWTDYGRYKLFVYISGKNYDPKIPITLGEDGVDFTALCMMQQPENRADAATLLSHSFMTQQQIDLRRQHSSFHRMASNSEFKTIPNITRYISDDSCLDAVDGENEDLTLTNEKLKEIYLKSMQAAKGTKESNRRSLSKASSVDLTLSDVQNVIEEKARAIKQMHLKLLVAEQTRKRSKSDEIGENSKNIDDDFGNNWRENTICITTGIASCRQNIASTFLKDEPV